MCTAAPVASTGVMLGAPSAVSILSAAPADVNFVTDGEPFADFSCLALPELSTGVVLGEPSAVNSLSAAPADSI